MSFPRLGQAGLRTRSLSSSLTLEGACGLRAEKQSEPTRILGNVVLRAPRLSDRVL